jgi:hypothetical protein
VSAVLTVRIKVGVSSADQIIGMKNKILGVIGVVWGGGLLVSALTKGVPVPTSSYGTGAFVGFLFGVALLAAGVWTLASRHQRT